MPASLRYVDPTARRGWFRRLYADFAGTRVALFFSRHVFWKLDPYLLKATGGRIGASFVIRTAVLETHGAKSGALRRNALIYFHDGDRVTVVASRAGDPRHPAWFHNLRAHPDVTFGGLPMRATVITDDAELARLWPLADNVFPPYANYRRRAAAVNRTIPIVQLAAR